jgi:3-deoxy-D-manno-octulosonic-acid transferase
MRWVYSIVISTLYVLMVIATLFHKKVRRFASGRLKIYNLALDKFCRLDKPCIWFHCPSMGEFEDAKQLIELTRQDAKLKILITFSSPTGYDYHHVKTTFAHISYLPYDFMSDIKRFIEKVKPTKLIVCRNDIWPNLLEVCTQKGIPTYLVDYSINSSIYNYPLFKQFYKHQLSKFKVIAVQNQNTFNFLSQKLGLQSLLLAGNTRIDSLKESGLPDNDAALLKDFSTDQPVIIFGSALNKDLKLIYDFKPSMFEKFKFILVEHEPKHNNYKKLKRHFKEQLITWKELREQKRQPSDCRILYIDTIGLLKQLYFYSNFAFIGGGFNRIGIHNILEPAIASNYILFGPNHRNYTEAVDLLKQDDCAIINNAADIEFQITNWLKKKIKSLNNYSYVVNNKGASEICYKVVFNLKEILNS